MNISNKIVANAVAANKTVAVNFVNDATLRKFIAEAKKCAAKAKALENEVERLMLEYSRFFTEIEPDSKYRQQVEDAYAELKANLRNMY